MDLHDRSKPKGIKRHYKVTEIRDRKMTERVLTRQERDRLDPNDVDVQIDEPRREIWIRHKGATKPTRYQGSDIVGIGTHEWIMLADAVVCAGDVAPLKSCSCVHQRVRRIRRLFQDSKNEEWFFLTPTQPSYGIAINTHRTWRFIETLAE